MIPSSASPPNVPPHVPASSSSGFLGSTFSSSPPSAPQKSSPSSSSSPPFSSRSQHTPTSPFFLSSSPTPSPPSSPTLGHYHLQHNPLFNSHHHHPNHHHYGSNLHPSSALTLSPPPSSSSSTSSSSTSGFPHHLPIHLLHHQPIFPSSVPSPCPSIGSHVMTTGKEDMSPPNTLNMYNGPDSFGDPKKKKGPAPRQQEELCLVCGDRASGYHYNALTCEGCKGFFRRSITKNAVYQCKYGNSCEIDMYMRRKCQECRLKKCLNTGMRPECVVPEYQCAIKRESKRAQKEKDKPNSTTKDSSPDKEEKPIIVNGNVVHHPMGTGAITHNHGAQHHPHMNGSMVNNHGKQVVTPMMTSTSTSSTLSPHHTMMGQTHLGVLQDTNILNLGVKPLTQHQEEMIKKLVYYQEEFESPSEEDVRKITAFPLGDSEEDSLKRFQHVTEMTILTVQLIVEFSKRVPGFDTLLREDQITLLKACSSEVMMLRCSRKYDIKTDSIVYANNQPYTRENYRSASIGGTADDLFNFCRSVCILKVDNAEYSLLTAIVIFSERPQLKQPDKVEKIQEFYLDTLRAYVSNNRPPHKCYFAKLLAILTELRSLGNTNSEVCFSLKVQNKRLPPFLAEIWDIQQ